MHNTHHSKMFARRLIGKQTNSQEQQSVLAKLKFIRDRRWSRAQKLGLLQTYKSPSRVYAAGLGKLRQTVGDLQTNDAKVSDQRLQLDLQWLSQPGHNLVMLGESAYPALLNEISDPPIALFAIGNLSLINEPKIAVVGSRRPTPIGAQITSRLASGLAELGIVVTSGMALGVDAIAHQAALDVGQATVAVMACGLDLVYPQRHRRLFDEIANKGLAISEYPPGVPATKYAFPQRNRIVSGVSYGVLIVEAAERSGTLITARLAAEQNREVMVVPGSSLSAQYHGSHRLLRQGAALTSSIDDIMFCLNGPLQKFCGRPGDAPQQNTIPVADADTKTLLKYIGYESTSMDSLIISSGLTAAEVCAMLVTLELQGVVAIASDGGYINLT
ncbi:MAG: DNA processing protein [Cryomorphaceae bacterium]|jgi:DNA processing protein